MHHLASDMTLDPILRRAFARVSCQIVRTYDDASEGLINMINRATAETELVEHRKRIGRRFADGRTLLSVSIREV